MRRRLRKSAHHRLINGVQTQGVLTSTIILMQAGMSFAAWKLKKESLPRHREDTAVICPRASPKQLHSSISQKHADRGLLSLCTVRARRFSGNTAKKSRPKASGLQKSFRRHRDIPLSETAVLPHTEATRTGLSNSSAVRASTMM